MLIEPSCFYCIKFLFSDPPKAGQGHVPDEVTANIRTFLAIQRPDYTLHSLLDRSDSEKRAWLALLSRKLHDETIDQVSDVIIELEPRRYMTVQNVQEPPSTQQSPVPDASS
ncbi:MAG: hypothetical protein ACXWPG_17940 [Ktedonobacteraceae bacterium]